MLPYGKFAGVYDKMGADEHSLKMVDYTRKIMRRFGINAADGLDLCCGTGSAIKAFCDNGIAMSGLDRSQQMLKIAAKKLRGRDVGLYCQELPRFEIKQRKVSGRTVLKQFDLVTCFYDSLNYLLQERQVKAAFRSVYRHLQPGGWFVFDMNTPHALKTIWNDQVFSVVRDEVAWVFRSDYNSSTRISDLEATFFVKKGKRWERFDELHTERGYPNRLIRAMLRDVGFRIKGYYRCGTFEKVTARTNRICAVVQRPE